MIGSAVISECEVYRYNLIRVWDEGKPRICFVLLNPSTADAQIDDNTLRRGIAFAKLWGYGSVEFVNLFAFRATDQAVLRRAADTMDVVGPENDTHILKAVRRAEMVVLAWGIGGSLLKRDETVLTMLKGFGHELWCLGKTKLGHPKHPLRLAASTPLRRWEPLPCNCGVAAGLRSDHEGECQAAYIQRRSGRMALPDKAGILNAVAKALEDPGTNTVARRIVMRRSVWDLACEIARELKKDGITRGGTEVLSIAQECGISFAHPLIVRMHQGTMAQGTAAAAATIAQLPAEAEVELSLQARADLYNAAFPNYPKVWVDKGWLLGVWNIGNNYKGSGYYGSYPPSYLKRITPMFPDQKRVLHLFSGSLPPGDYIRFDIREDIDADVYGNAEELTKHFAPDSFDIIYADVPYSEADAQRYGTCLCNRNKVVKECATVLAPGGWLIWMDQVLPMYRKVEWARCIEIAISRSTNHRVRAVFGFRREAKVDVTGRPLAAPLEEQRAAAMEF